MNAEEIKNNEILDIDTDVFDTEIDLFEIGEFDEENL